MGITRWCTTNPCFFVNWVQCVQLSKEVLIAKSYWIAPTQRHITSKRSGKRGDANWCKGVEVGRPSTKFRFMQGISLSSRIECTRKVCLQHFAVSNELLKMKQEYANAGVVQRCGAAVLVHNKSACTSAVLAQN